VDVASTLIWRLMPADSDFPTVYLLQIRSPQTDDVERLTAMGWEAAELDKGRVMFATTDLDVALSSGISGTRWLDSVAIAVE
jgi:hypothetical protein